MTADGELFVDEVVRDELVEKCSKFADLIEEGGCVDAGKFSEVWDISQLPSKDKVPIENVDGEEVGFMHFELDFTVIKDDFNRRRIEPTVEKVYPEWK